MVTGHLTNLLIKPTTGSGNKLIIQDQDGGEILTSTDSGASIDSGVSFPVHQSTELDYDFSGTINFDNCGRAGYYGPTLTQARSSYTGEYLQGTWLNNLDYFHTFDGHPNNKGYEYLYKCVSQIVNNTRIN